MRIELKYGGQSAVVAGRSSARGLRHRRAPRGGFLPRRPRRPLILRDALAALYQVVLSDLKYRPRDRPAFQPWLAEQDRKFLQSLSLKSEAIRTESDAREARLGELDAARDARMQPFSARGRLISNTPGRSSTSSNTCSTQ